MPSRPYLLLVIDDDAVGLARLVEVLRGAGHDVIGTSTPQAARQALMERPVELLLCAERLVGMSGIDLLRQVRSLFPFLACGLLVDERTDLLEAEARRQQIVLLERAAAPDRTREAIAQILARTRRRQRWPRKLVTEPVSLTVDTVPVRLVNVSYGGLGFVVPAAATPLPSRFAVRLPTAATTVAAELVWSRPLPATGARQCGAAIADDPRGEEIWKAFVDQLR
jgi:CheY-like chemotaxis protein